MRRFVEGTNRGQRPRCFLNAWKTGSTRTIRFRSLTSLSMSLIWPSLGSAGLNLRQLAGLRIIRRYC